MRISLGTYLSHYGFNTYENFSPRHGTRWSGCRTRPRAAASRRHTHIAADGAPSRPMPRLTVTSESEFIRVTFLAARRRRNTVSARPGTGLCVLQFGILR